MMAKPGFSKHPKFLRLVKILGEPHSHVRGYVECLWDVAFSNGDPVIGDAVDIEMAADYPGEAGKLCQALLECGGTTRAGLIEKCPDQPGAYQIHDFFDHCPGYVRARSEKNRARLSAIRSEAGRKGAEARWQKTPQVDETPEVNGKSMANMAPIRPDQTRPAQPPSELIDHLGTLSKKRAEIEPPTSAQEQDIEDFKGKHFGGVICNSTSSICKQVAELAVMGVVSEAFVVDGVQAYLKSATSKAEPGAYLRRCWENSPYRPHGEAGEGWFKRLYAQKVKS